MELLEDKHRHFWLQTKVTELTEDNTRLKRQLAGKTEENEELWKQIKSNNNRTETKHEVEQLRARLDSIGAAVMAVNIDGRITEWNRASAYITGLPREKVMGTHIEEDLNETLSKISTALKQGLEGKVTQPLRMIVSVPDDENPCPFILQVNPVRKHDGLEITGAIAMMMIAYDGTDGEEEAIFTLSDMEERLSVERECISNEAMRALLTQDVDGEPNFNLGLQEAKASELMARMGYVSPIKINTKRRKNIVEDGVNLGTSLVEFSLAQVEERP